MPSSGALQAAPSQQPGVERLGDASLSPKGSVLFDGFSFSGADIKVVIHLYDRQAQSRSAQEANEVREQIRSTEAGLRDIEGRISDIVAINGGDIGNLHIDIMEALAEQAEKRRNLARALVGLNDQLLTLERGVEGFSTKVLAEIQTLSVSTHRDKVPVRAIGHVYPRGFTRGPRLIAGSMIFTVFHQTVLQELLESDASDFHYGRPTTALIDQIPPFDITIVFANEYGRIARMAILGAEFVNEGQTMSIEDLLLENVVQYVARDIDPMRAVSERKLDANNLLSQDASPLKASDLLNERDYQQYKSKLRSPFERSLLRNNPYV